MYRYSTYIAKHLIHSTLLITFSLTSIVWLTQALRFIDFIVNQGVSITVFLTLTTLLVPSLVFMILPPAMFCAVLFVYNKLKVDSELVVLQAAGLSRWKLAIPAMQVAVGFTALAYLIAFWMQPASYREFKEMQLFLRNTYVSILLQDGVFNNPVDGLTVFIRERDKDGTLRGILVHDNRLPEAPVTMMADEGSLVQTPQGPRFLLTSGNRQEKRNGRLSFLNFERYTLDISLYTKEMGKPYIDPQGMFIGELFADDPNASEGENHKRFAEAHQRLLWPGYVISMTVLALAVLLSGQFNRRGHWQRIAIAVAFGAAILFTAVGLRGMMASNPHTVVVAYLNLLLPLAACWWILSDRPIYGMGAA